MQQRGRVLKIKSMCQLMSAVTVTVTIAVLATVASIGVGSQKAQAQVNLPGTPRENCVSKAEMQTIASHFTQFSQYANADYCYDGSQTANLISSIMFMRQTAFSPVMNPSKDELFTGRFAKSWYDYFIGRINTLEIVNSCPKGVVAYVYAFGGKTMYACPLALTDTFSSLDRASVFMHEARHIDGFPHITCSKGPRQGLRGACDTRISDGGSYAVTVETYAQLAKFATALHPALRAYAKASAVIYADEAFENQVRIQRADRLVLLGSDLNFQALQAANGSFLPLGKVNALGHIIHRAQHLVIFPDDKNLKAQYLFTKNEGEIEQSPGDAFTEYNQQSPEEKAQLVDFHSGTQWNLRVYKSKLHFACDPNSPTFMDLQIPQGEEPRGLIYPNGYDRIFSSTHLAMKSGAIYETGCSNLKPFIRAANLKYDQDFKRIYKLAGVTYGLSFGGKLFKIEGGKSTAIATPIDGTIKEITPQQSFDFFEQ